MLGVARPSLVRGGLAESQSTTRADDAQHPLLQCRHPEKFVGKHVVVGTKVGRSHLLSDHTPDLLCLQEMGMHEAPTRSPVSSSETHVQCVIGMQISCWAT